MRRSSSLLAAVAVAALALAPSMADARAGAGGSSGSRGSRTYTAPPATNTAPNTAAPMERSMTPRTAPAPGYGAAAPAAGMSRGGMFASGLMGGLLGVGLGGLLMGNGLFGGFSGFASVIGLLLQLALLFFIGRWLFRKFMQSRQPQPAMAGGAPNLFARTAQQPGPRPMGGLGGGLGAAAATAPATAPVAIGQADYQAFDRMLHAVQAAWSAHDPAALRQLSTPEMAQYFDEQIADQQRRGVRNEVRDVKLEQGDLSEAWSEGRAEYATVAMRFSMVDVTSDAAGRVVEGDPARRTQATELWTFVRERGGRWTLSAIQQTR